MKRFFATTDTLTNQSEKFPFHFTQQGPELRDKLPAVMSITGTTGSGKSALAETIYDQSQQKFSITPLLVSVDAVALYRGFDIGSAKPDAETIRRYQWCGIDIAEPEATVTARNFIDSVKPAITHALQNQQPVLLVGGSMFYERALIEGMSPGDPSNPDFQAQLRSESDADLATRLYQRDARFESKAHVNDRYRLTRYLDLSERQGLSYDKIFITKVRPAEWEPWTETPTLLLGLEMPVPELKKRLASRIKKMMDRGWIEECQTLRAKHSPTAPAFGTVGYAEIMAHLANPQFQNPTELESEILTRHLQLAKKQRTWLRGMQKGAK